MYPSAVLLLLVAATAATSQSQALRLPPAAAVRHGTGAACMPSERDALLAFKRGITGDPAGRLASWHEGDQDCCRWSGVRCSNRTGHVIGLRLGNGNNMYTDDPRLLPNDTALSGQISPSLISLHHLESLDLSFNNLLGPAGRVPEFLGLFKNLRYLNLSSMPLFGRVPPQLGNLSNLHYLDLSPGTYYVPWSDPNLYSTDISWLSNLPLMYLDMDSVILNGTVDWAHVVNMIPSLKVLRLSKCWLTSANQSLPHLNLTHLVELSLSWNRFDHPVASCWFWNLTSLQHLGLAATYLFGQIPDALGGMMFLQALDFSDGYGGIDIMTANMTNLCSLESIDLGDNSFYGNIRDFFQRLPQCYPSKLKEMYLGFNNFSGVLPNWIGRWTTLRVLDLFDNHLSGPVPSELGALKNLEYLDLGNNNLDGVITQQHFAGLKKLKHIALSRNSLKIALDPDWLPPFRLERAYFASCQMGPLFPTWLQSQVNILELDISNTSIFDRLPDWFATTFSKATFLSFSNNGINGTLPTNLENMISLQKLYLDSNQITGPIPLLPVNLYVLDISNNGISGTLPTNLKNMISLQELYLDSNQLTGPIPLLPVYLYALGISRNHLSGQLPSNICDLNVDALNLANNHLEGKLPVCNQQRRATVLILRNNMLSGKLQLILETYTELQVLDLAWNNFTGSIPATITRLGGLFHLNLAGNSISGTLPYDLSNLRVMKTGYPTSDYYPDTVNLSMTMKGQELYYYSSAFSHMVVIDLSSNHLTGGIPEEIASLYAVVNLNLSRNNLTGKIPERIGVMQSLESLDLSRNNLYGEIPQSLSNITYLGFMDLSHNNLTGRIPSGTQLDTLYAQNPLIYDGNVGLCGYPLHKNCTDDNREPKHGDQERDDHVVLTFSFGLGIGYVVGLWVVFCLILFNKSWRIAQFRLFDKAFDKVYVFAVVTWARWAKQTTTQ